MKSISILFSVLVIFSCNNSQVEKSVDTVESLAVKANTIDTLVGKKDVTKIIPGSEYLSKAYSYVVIAGKDTSPFRCHFSKWKADSTLFFVTNFSKDLTYRRQKNELVRILAEAHKDFSLTTLNTIGLGRLITTGDLAVKVSQQFYAIKFNSELDAFLLGSAITEDMNMLLKPYGMEIKKVVTEKQEFLPHKDVTQYSVIETDPKDITDEIVDCIVYLKVGKI